jgi:predicted transcriptional regulator
MSATPGLSYYRKRREALALLKRAPGNARNLLLVLKAFGLIDR